MRARRGETAMRRAVADRRPAIVDLAFSKTSATVRQRHLRLIARALGIPVVVSSRQVADHWRIYALPIDDETCSPAAV